MIELETYATDTLVLADSDANDILGYADGQGHPDFPCLSRTHSPSSCVPCLDFSPWLRQRVRAADVDGVGDYLWRVRQANPGVGESVAQFRQHYRALGAMILAAPLTRHLAASEEALLDLRTALLLLAVHEGFSGFIMTGDAPEFVAAAMSPHHFNLLHTEYLVQRRNGFVAHMGREMSYWAGWPTLDVDGVPPIAPPDDPDLHEVLGRLALLPLGARAHASDALRHFSAETRVPRTLASLSRYETRKRGLDVDDSSRRILETGLVVRATDLEAWLAGWTRRDLLGFLAQAGLRLRNSWGKERLAEVALKECEELLRLRLAESGAVELAPQFAAGARRLREYLDASRETWRLWLGFGTGLEM